MGTHINKIHILDPDGIPGSCKTFCGVNLKPKDVTRQPGKATCQNCHRIFKLFRQQTQFVTQHYDRNWALVKEKHFILHLGTGKWSNARMSRKDLLLSYIYTIMQRNESWAKDAHDYALQLYKQEFGKLP